jgi:hypothetical protein
METTPHVIDLGDFIYIPAWGMTGCVIGIRPSMLGSEQSQSVLLQQVPDDPQPVWYRLEPDEFEVVG